MQTDRGIYHKRVCDRCGAVLGGRDTGDLCPECYAEYKQVIGQFNRGKKGQKR